MLNHSRLLFHHYLLEFPVTPAMVSTGALGLLLLMCKVLSQSYTQLLQID